jgi:hypothetical protein
MQSMVHECRTQIVQLSPFIRIEFTRYLHEYNLSQPEKSWQSYEYLKMDIKLTTINKNLKKPPFWRNMKTKPQDKMNNKKISLNINNGHMHVPKPSTTTCMVMTNYHNNPIDFISSWQWVKHWPSNWVFFTRLVVIRKLSHDVG